jgi:acylphosphatase
MGKYGYLHSIFRNGQQEQVEAFAEIIEKAPPTELRVATLSIKEMV